MLRNRLVMACCVLLSASPMLAQSERPAGGADPISGTWAGEFVLQRDPSSAVSITMQLKFDGKRAVSGTFTGLPTPGDVKAGTFDPKNGALKLDLGKQGEQAVLLVLEGTVAEGTATGHFTGEETDVFKLTRKTKESSLPPRRPECGA